MNGLAYTADLATLGYYVDCGVTESLSDSAYNRTKPLEILPVQIAISHSNNDTPSVALLGKFDAYEEAVKLASAANTLEELAKAISGFDGIGAKKTAANMVFSSGNKCSKIMVIGDAPRDDEERQSIPFAGENGRLLDKIFASIGLDRTAEDPKNSLYLSTLVNWRPPGNRSLTDAEIQVSLPFLERHIQLIAPEILVLCGGVVGKALLGSNESLNRLRNKWHEYTPQSKELLLGESKGVPTIVVYHPIFLLETPSQKKAMWKDVLEIAGKIKK